MRISSLIILSLIIVGGCIAAYGIILQIKFGTSTEIYTNYCKQKGYDDYYSAPLKDYTYNLTSITCEKRTVNIENNTIISRDYIKKELIYDIPIEPSYGIIYFAIGFVIILFTLFILVPMIIEDEY